MEFNIGDLVTPAVDLMSSDPDDLALVVGFDEDGDLLLEPIKEGETFIGYARHWKHTEE